MGRFSWTIVRAFGPAGDNCGELLRKLGFASSVKRCSDGAGGAGSGGHDEVVNLKQRVDGVIGLQRVCSTSHPTAHWLGGGSW